MVQLASFQGVIRILLIILVVYYGMKILTRILAPYLLKSMAKKAEKRFGEQYRDFRYEEPKAEVGETTIDKMPDKKSSSNKDMGEYVDYEEID